MNHSDVASNGRLAAKTAIVTGAGRGIGRGIALLFASEGARVVVADNGCAPDGTGADVDVAQRVAQEITALGGTAYAETIDISDWRAVEQLVARAVDTWGRLDIVLNAAGNMRPRSIVDITEADFDAVMRVHLNGTLNTSHFAARHWVEQKQPGRLINLASRMANYGHPLMLSYTAAKAGMIGFTRSCANALVAYGVTANVIIPSAATRMVDAMSKAALEARQATGKWASDAATGTMEDPAHVAPMAVFLASDRAAHVTGRVFGAYGGRYSLWSEPREEREVHLTWPQDYECMLEAFDTSLARHLGLEDLPMPLPSVEADWSDCGGRPPRWDFSTRP